MAIVLRSNPVRKIPTESEDQIAFVSWFRLQFKGVRIFAIPNGMFTKSKRVAIRAKKEGMSSGVPDLYVPKWKLWIEFKRVSGGSLDKNQKDWLDYLENDCGDNTMVVYGLSEAIEKTNRFFKSITHT